MIERLLHKIDCFLYKKQFYSPPVRRVLCLQIALALVALLVALPLIPLTLWPSAFAAGVILALFNFWHIARFASGNVNKYFSALMAAKYFLWFCGRLVLTGLALTYLIVYCSVPIIPLVAGLSSVLCIVLFWSIFKTTPKHAREV